MDSDLKGSLMGTMFGLQGPESQEEIRRGVESGSVKAHGYLYDLSRATEYRSLFERNRCTDEDFTRCRFTIHELDEVDKGLEEDLEIFRSLGIKKNGRIFMFNYDPDINKYFTNANIDVMGNVKTSFTDGNHNEIRIRFSIDKDVEYDCVIVNNLENVLTRFDAKKILVNLRTAYTKAIYCYRSRVNLQYFWSKFGVISYQPISTLYDYRQYVVERNRKRVVESDFQIEHFSCFEAYTGFAFDRLKITPKIDNSYLVYRIHKYQTGPLTCKPSSIIVDIEPPSYKDNIDVDKPSPYESIASFQIGKTNLINGDLVDAYFGVNTYLKKLNFKIGSFSKVGKFDMGKSSSSSLVLFKSEVKDKVSGELLLRYDIYEKLVELGITGFRAFIDTDGNEKLFDIIMDESRSFCFRYGLLKIFERTIGFRVFPLVPIRDAKNLLYTLRNSSGIRNRGLVIIDGVSKLGLVNKWSYKPEFVVSEEFAQKYHIFTPESHWSATSYIVKYDNDEMSDTFGRFCYVRRSSCAYLDEEIILNTVKSIMTFGEMETYLDGFEINNCGFYRFEKPYQDKESFFYPDTPDQKLALLMTYPRPLDVKGMLDTKQLTSLYERRLIYVRLIQKNFGDIFLRNFLSSCNHLVKKEKKKYLKKKLKSSSHITGMGFYWSPLGLDEKIESPLVISDFAKYDESGILKEIHIELSHKLKSELMEISDPEEDSATFVQSTVPGNVSKAEDNDDFISVLRRRPLRKDKEDKPG